MDHFPFLYYILYILIYIDYVTEWVEACVSIDSHTMVVFFIINHVFAVHSR